MLVTALISSKHFRTGENILRNQEIYLVFWVQKLLMLSCGCFKQNRELFLKNTFHNIATSGLTFTRCEQPGLRKAVPFLSGEKTKRNSSWPVGIVRRLYKVAHFRGCDKDKQRETSFDSGDGFFSQDASLFMPNEVKIDWSTEEWNIKNNSSSVWNTLRIDIIY